MMDPLKRNILELLDKDLEFRYAVAGYLGLSEILKRLGDLTEEQGRLAKEQGRLAEEQSRLTKEQSRLAEEQGRLVKEQTRMWEELRMLREDMVKGFERHDVEIVKLREDFNKMLEAIRSLQEGQMRVERRVDSLESAMISGFSELSKFAGLTFEEFVRKFLTASLRRSGEIPEHAELGRGLVEGEEINLFLEEPLIVGEATGYAESVGEMLKLLRKAEIVKVKYSREPKKIIVILTARRDVVKELRRIAEEKSIELIIGKTVE
jgi:predicted  nucleic acid-binding Zn-ribbon protein